MWNLSTLQSIPFLINWRIFLQTQEYLPRHFSLLSISSTTVPTQSPPFVNVSVTIAWDTVQTTLLGGIPLFHSRDSGKKTNVQSTRTSVMHLLQSFWFIIDLGAAQHLCCWPPKMVQGHFDSRCWGIEAFLIHLQTLSPLRIQTRDLLATSSFL